MSALVNVFGQTHRFAPTVGVNKYIQRYLNRALKHEQEEEYIEKEEILNSIRNGLKEIKERRRTGRKGIDAEELLNEL